MANPAISATFTLDQARARWVAAQGLTGAPTPDLSGTLAQTGWLRTLGGVDAYLALAARHPGVRKADVDAELAAGRLRVANAVRGCVYLIPEQHRGLALAIANRLQRPKLEKDCQKVGVGAAEVADLGQAVLEILARGPQTTDSVRGALGTVRSLGEAGKKVGLSSPLPPTLRFLERASGCEAERACPKGQLSQPKDEAIQRIHSLFRLRKLDGRIERVPVGTTLDTERYLWTCTEAPPSLPTEPLTDLAAFFLAIAGPATLDDFAEWSGFGKREAAAALARAGAVPVAVEGFADLAWIGADVEAPPPEGAHLLAFEENLFVLHGGTAPLAAARHHHRPLAAWGSYNPSTLGTAKHVSQRLVLLDGLIAGAWDWDAAAEEVVVGLYDGPSARTDLARARAATTRIIKEIGHARSYLLDTDARVAERAARLRP